MADRGRGRRRKGGREGGRLESERRCTFFAADLLALSLSLSLSLLSFPLPLFLVQSLPKVMAREEEKEEGVRDSRASSCATARNTWNH